MSSEDEEMEVNKDQSENDMEDDDDDDDTSSDSSEEQLDDTKQENELVALREIVQSNLYNYQSHLDYISKSREYGNLEHLRFARQTMSEVFPLTEQLWLEWLDDEKKLLISTTEENKTLVDLFERAINDYLSIMIWIEYVQYRLPYYMSMNSIENFRNLFERGLSACGVHLPAGGLFWAAYIETEKAILDGLRMNYEQNSENSDLKEKLLQHVDYVLTLYRRQLAVPLRGMSDIYYKDYQSFCEQYKEFLPVNYTEQYDLKVKREFDLALEYLEKCEKFEKELDNTNRSVATYRRYIAFEKEPARIQCLYERAIVDHCLDGDLWLSYIDFIEEHLSSPKLCQAIFDRSLRNCPWVAGLWIRYAEFMESSQTADHSQLKQIYDRALNSDPTNLESFVNIQLAYMQYRRRHYYQQLSSTKAEQCEALKEEIRHVCEATCDQYQELFSGTADPKLFLKYNGQLELYWIHFETQSFHSIDRARQIWNGRTLMSKTHNQLIANLWKNFYYTEIHFGDEKHARRVLYRALNHIETMDYPMSVCDLLLEHEKKYGTIEQLKETKEKLKEIQKKLIPKEKPQVNNKKQIEPSKKSKKTTNSKMDTTAPPVHTNGKTNDQSKTSPRKRQLSSEEVQTAKKKPAPAAVDNDGFKIPAPPPPATSVSTPASSSSSSTFVDPANTDHLNTVFIANLAYDIDEQKIRDALSPAGPIKDVRIVKHEWSGKSKGFGYVDFATTEGYRQGLKLDHTLINGRPMYISPYDPNRSTSNDLTKKFKYSTALEQNKLFIKNLPFSSTKEDVGKLFTEKGFHVKDVRLVTHKSGKSKGLAYVEFDDAQTASQAVIQLDGTTIGEHTIQVAISNPPQRKEPVKSTSTEAKPTSLGEAPRATGPRGRGYSQISLVPRKVTAAKNQPATTTTTTTANAMNNDDFRKMLLNKK
ncbi:unnamed protein product [Adineta ricciae]|uniref:RRM domain-containing protein n=1 Tax=Adineta ricciae TaxID=249248 RepID=A0A815ZP63_ADIRI|nr:unnamed protein product [Adineta ricciae]CAF1585727.1 unnamed protein product [Adineta ricciae]